jgi:hypothetical protein
MYFPPGLCPPNGGRGVRGEDRLSLGKSSMRKGGKGGRPFEFEQEFDEEGGKTV